METVELAYNSYGVLFKWCIWHKRHEVQNDTWFRRGQSI